MIIQRVTLKGPQGSGPKTITEYRDTAHWYSEQVLHAIVIEMIFEVGLGPSHRMVA